MLLSILAFQFLLLTSSVSAHGCYDNHPSKECIDDYVKGIEEIANSVLETPLPEETFDESKYDEEAAFKNAKRYDFIVVGSGAAGSVIANRLSEIPEWKVLLLEAGEVETPYTQVPQMFAFLEGTKYSWNDVLEPQNSWCLGMVNRQCLFPTGKILGGGTSINGMMYTRGNKKDYDTWAKQGNEGWSYKDVLPFFLKSEDSTLLHYDPRYHLQGGPLYVETRKTSQLIETFLSAGKEVGYKVLDYNGRQQTSFSYTQATTKHGIRYSQAQSYLLPFERRRNLHIQPLSRVIQIIIDPVNKQATGVKYIRNDTLYIATVRKEVILSAGPINSPHLLMLSGVGPQNDLAALNITVLKDLKVGKHLTDHAGFQGVTGLLNVTKIDNGDLRQQVKTMLATRSGPLASSPGMALAYLKTHLNTDDGDYPDIEFILSETAFLESLRIKEEYRPILAPESKYITFLINVMPTHPKSRGTLQLKSKDPFKRPIIKLGQFGDPEGHDIEVMLAGIKKAIDTINAPAFQKLGAHLTPEVLKDCAHLGYGSDEYWKCSARYLSSSLRHQAGTCRMGPVTDRYAVVDSKLRVFGINRLRVADSSVIPVSITGHTHAPSSMIGEKAADIIKKDWF